MQVLKNTENKPFLKTACGVSVFFNEYTLLANPQTLILKWNNTIVATVDAPNGIILFREILDVMTLD